MALEEMQHRGISDDKVDKKERVKIYRKHNLSGQQWSNCYCSFRKRFPDRVLGPKTAKIETTPSALHELDQNAASNGVLPIAQKLLMIRRERSARKP